ncbi:hypothetical protein SODG_007309 [Sodalis praecaptivus]
MTGKYRRADLSEENVAEVSPTRKGIIASTGHLNAQALDIADELGASRSQVALAWTLLNPAVVAPIVGARTLEQAEDNFKALSVVFTEHQCDRLEKASALAPIFPARFMGRPMAQQLMFGCTTILHRRGMNEADGKQPHEPLNHPTLDENNRADGENYLFPFSCSKRRKCSALDREHCAWRRRAFSAP